jgi:hypothetical protein
MPSCGAGPSSVALSLAKTSVRPLSLVNSPQASLASSPPFHSRSPFPTTKTGSKDHEGSLARSWLRFWLCPSLSQAPIFGERVSKPLLCGGPCFGRGLIMSDAISTAHPPNELSLPGYPRHFLASGRARPNFLELRQHEVRRIRPLRS